MRERVITSHGDTRVAVSMLLLRASPSIVDATCSVWTERGDGNVSIHSNLYLPCGCSLYC